MRARLLLGAALLALAACGDTGIAADPVIPAPTVIGGQDGSNLRRFCDRGRAIYVVYSPGRGSVAMAVVPDAPECAAR